MAKYSKFLYPVLAILCGASISVMVFFNTELSLYTGGGVSYIANQGVGFAVMAAIMAALPHNATVNKPVKEKAPWWMWFGGIAGVPSIAFTTISSIKIGISMAVSASIMGSTLTAFIYDLVGFMGSPKVKFDARKLGTMLLSFVGLAIMAADGAGISLEKVPYILLSMASGAITNTQQVYNSAFGKRKGTFFSARNNMITGLLAGLVYYFIFETGATVEGFSHLGEVPFVYIVGGGVFGCSLVILANTVYPHLPVIYASLLLSIGQIVTSIIIDLLGTGSVAANTVIGALIIILGMAINLVIDEHDAKIETKRAVR